MSCKTTCNIEIGSGRCKGDCCGPVPIPKEVLDRNRFKIQRPIAQEIEMFPGEFVPLTRDLNCVFLTKDFKCAIYDERPWVCRKFGSGDPSPRLQCPHGVVTEEIVFEPLNLKG